MIGSLWEIRFVCSMACMAMVLGGGLGAAWPETTQEMRPGAVAAGSATAYTPPPGSAERKAILDALRAMLRRLEINDVVFVVRLLKVSKGWAWVEAQPRSTDGKQRFEDINCLLRRPGKEWQVLECRPCCGECEDDPDCPDDARYFRKLRSSHPQAPAEIFPAH